MAKRIIKGKDARKVLLDGMNELADVVLSTMGPRGKAVIIDDRHNPVYTTKDGVTVARNIVLENDFQNVGSEILKEAASKTNDNAGDGTTTSIALARALVRGGYVAIESDSDHNVLKAGIEKGVDVAISTIKAISKPIESHEQIRNVATLSANGDIEIGNLIGDAFEKMGKDGIILVEESQNTDSYIDIVEGFKFDKGFLSGYFINDHSKMTATYDNAKVFVYNGKISVIQEMVVLLDAAAKRKSPILIIAEDVMGEGLATAVYNKTKQNYPVVAVKAPAFGDNRREMLMDIASLAGCKMASPDEGFRLIDANFDSGSEFIGSINRVVVSAHSTTMYRGASSKKSCESRIRALSDRLAETTDEMAKNKLKERIAKMSSKIAVLYVGAQSEIEMREKRDRVDDALSATKAAIESGIVPGGGTAFLFAAKSIKQLLNADDYLPSFSQGMNVVHDALLEPTKNVIDNAGEFDSSTVIKMLQEKNAENITTVFDVRKSEYVNINVNTIVDPAKVLISALTNAVSVATTVLLSDYTLVEMPIDNGCNNCKK